MSRIGALPDTAVLDASSERMILVDAPEEHLRAALRNMPGWTMTPERTVPLPDNRKKVLRPPDDDTDD